MSPIITCMFVRNTQLGCAGWVSLWNGCSRGCHPACQDTPVSQALPHGRFHPSLGHAGRQQQGEPDREHEGSQAMARALCVLVSVLAREGHERSPRADGESAGSAGWWGKLERELRAPSCGTECAGVCFTHSTAVLDTAAHPTVLNIPQC